MTGNGSAFGQASPAEGLFTSLVPRPKAPSFLAVNKWTSKVVSGSAAPGKDIQYG